MSGRKSDHHRVAGLDVVMGILRLGCGQADGLGLFGDSVGHFTASLAPFIALPLVGSAIGLIDDAGIDIIGDLLAFWCSLLLAPAVLSWEFARKWRREGLWLRYATAFNWCIWAILVFAVLLLVAVSLLLNMGMSSDVGGSIFKYGVGAYALWLHWFLARHGLMLSRGRAALLVVLVSLLTSALVLAPVLVAQLTDQ